MSICICLSAFAVGCAPNANGVWQPSLPWTRKAPQTAANPWQSDPANLAGTLPRTPSAGTLPSPIANPVARNSNGLSYLRDLMKRNEEQQTLANQQRQRLEELTRRQAQDAEKERLYVIQQREKERAALLKQYQEKEQQLASREQKYRGQFDQLRTQTAGLDSNNRDLHAELARSKKETNLLQEELALFKRRLDESTQQLSVAQRSSQESGQRLQAIQASASQRRGNAAIRANSSVTQSITAVMVPGMDIRQDGDLVRMSIPTDKLFMQGTAQLHQGSQPYMDQITEAIRRHYPQQIVGVEAHTDHSSTGLTNTQWRNHHQLTAAQSMAVFEQLTNRNISPHQLFVLGHGGNHPLVSGGTPQGQSMNRRVEIVVYPETYGQR